MVDGSLVTDAQWARIAPLLPRQPARGRPRRDDRDVFEAVAWLLRSGARWRDLPRAYPRQVTCWRRLRRWARDGVWAKAWRVYVTSLDARQRRAWSSSTAGERPPVRRSGEHATRRARRRGRAESWWSVANALLADALRIRR